MPVYVGHLFALDRHSTAGLDADRRLELGGRQRQIAQALSCRIGDGIGDRGGGPLPSLASAEEWQARPIDDVDLDAVWHAMESAELDMLPNPRS